MTHGMPERNKSNDTNIPCALNGRTSDSEILHGIAGKFKLVEAFGRRGENVRPRALVILRALQSKPARLDGQTLLER